MGKIFKQPIFGIILLALGVRLFLIWAVPSDFSHSAGNYHFDNAVAESLIREGNFGEERYIAPGFPVVLAGAKVLTGNQGLWSVRYLQLVLSIVLIILGYLLALAIGSKRVGIITALILTFWPPLLLQLFSLLPDLLSTVLISAILLAGLHFYRRSSWLMAVILGLLFAGLALTEPAGLFLPTVFLAIIFIYIAWSQGWRGVKPKLGPAILIVVIFSLALVPWVHRNTRVFGSFSQSPIIQKQFERDFFTSKKAFKNSYTAFAPEHWRELIHGTGQFFFIPYQLDALDPYTTISYKKLLFEVLAGENNLSFKITTILILKILAGLLQVGLLSLAIRELWRGRERFFSWLFVGSVAFIWLGVVIYSGGYLGLVSPMNGFFFFFVVGLAVLASRAVDNFLGRERGVS